MMVESENGSGVVWLCSCILVNFILDGLDNKGWGNCNGNGKKICRPLTSPVY